MHLFLGGHTMRLLLIICVSLCSLASVNAQAPKIQIANPTGADYEIFFRPEQAKQFLTPGLKIPARQKYVVNLESPGKYKTVLRSLTHDRQRIDSVIGWVDYRRAASGSNAVIKFEPYVATETREENQPVTTYVDSVRIDASGRSYTVKVPVMQTRTRTIEVSVLKVKVTLTIGDLEVNASDFISDNP